MLRDEARRASKVDLALRAVAAEEHLEPTPEAMDEEIARLAEGSGHTPASLRDELARNGRLGSLRAAVTKQLAADWVLERVTYVDETGSVIDRALLEAESEDEAGEDAEAGTASDAVTAADDDTSGVAEQVDQTPDEHEEHQ